MPLPNVRCKFIERGFKENLLLLPGWAADHRIFGLLDLDYNYILPTGHSFMRIEEFLAILEKHQVNTVSIFGWSLGGFIAYQLGQKYPQKIKEITLVGIRKKYSREELAALRTALQQSKKATLSQFYRNCFSAQEQESYRWFKNTLWHNYLTEFDTVQLLEGLDFLSTAEINPLAAPAVPLRIIHGSKDEIAPVPEALSIKNELPHAKYFCFEDAGHIVFLNPDFKRAFTKL